MPTPSKPYRLLLNGIEGASLTYIRGTDLVYQVQVSTGDGEIVSLVGKSVIIELFSRSTRTDTPLFSRVVIPDVTLGAYGFGTFALPSAFNISRGSYFAYLRIDDNSSPSGQIIAGVVTAAGAGYESVPTLSVVGNDGGTGAVLVAVLSGGGLKRIDVSNYGSGYLATPQVTLTAPVSGTRASASVRMDYADTGISAVTMTAGGSNYTTPPTVSFGSGGSWVATALMGINGVTFSGGNSGYLTLPTFTSTGGGGSGDTYQVRLVASGMQTFTVTAGGSGYTTATVTVTGAEGTGCSGSAIITGGVIVAIGSFVSGSGYTSVPTVTITGDGTGATAIAVRLASPIASVTVLTAGTGFTSLPVGSFSGGGGVPPTTTTHNLKVVGVTVSVPGVNVNSFAPSVSFSGGGGSGASATAITNGAKVGSLSISTAGTGYTTPPTITFTGGTPAVAAVAVARLNSTLVGVTVTTAGSGYQAGASVVVSGGSPTTAGTISATVGAGIARVADTPSSLLVT